MLEIAWQVEGGGIFLWFILQYSSVSN